MRPNPAAVPPPVGSPSRSDRWRIPLALALIGGLLVGGLLVVLATWSFADPAPPDFLVGVSREADGTLRLWMGNCDGGDARRITVSEKDASVGDEVHLADVPVGEIASSLRSYTPEQFSHELLDLCGK